MSKRYTHGSEFKARVGIIGELRRSCPLPGPLGGCLTCDPLRPGTDHRRSDVDPWRPTWCIADRARRNQGHAHQLELLVHGVGRLA